MPLDPNNPHADTPHAKTVRLASQGWQYGCHTSLTADGGPRGVQTEYFAHPWSHASTEFVITTWLPKACGHLERTSDSACEGCANRNRK